MSFISTNFNETIRFTLLNFILVTNTLRRQHWNNYCYFDLTEVLLFFLSRCPDIRLPPAVVGSWHRTLGFRENEAIVCGRGKLVGFTVVRLVPDPDVRAYISVAFRQRCCIPAVLRHSGSVAAFRQRCGTPEVVRESSSVTALYRPIAVLRR